MKKPRVKEWHRTIVLLALLLTGLLVIYWQGSNVQDNFVETIGPETSQDSGQ